MYKICIDAGHNPTGSVADTGAFQNGIYEQDKTYEIATHVGNLLNQHKEFSYVLTRPNEKTVLGKNVQTSLQERTSISNRGNADIFVSIHCNSSFNTNVNGTMTFIIARGGDREALANSIHNSIVRNTGMVNLGVRLDSFYVLKNTEAPAVLVECGFLSNVSDAEKLRTNAVTFAESIYQGICEYFDVKPILGVESTIRKLSTLGVINSPDYWMDVVSGKVEPDKKNVEWLLLKVGTYL